MWRKPVKYWNRPTFPCWKWPRVRASVQPNGSLSYSGKRCAPAKRSPATTKSETDVEQHDGMPEIRDGGGLIDPAVCALGVVVATPLSPLCQ